MLVRLLVAVLMLVGPSPVRACTCATTANLPAATHEDLPTAVSTAPQKSECGCRSKSAPESCTRASDESDHDHGGARASQSDSDHQPHHPNCPAVAAQPPASAIPTPAPDAPADCDLSFLTCVEAANGGHIGVADRADSGDRVRSVPLYILLLTLRN